MSASIHSLPNTIALSQEPMLVSITTNNVTSARARLDIALAHPSAGPAIDQVWTLGWAGKYLQFTFKAIPNSFGLQLPICDLTTGVTAKYMHQLAEVLMQHEWISDQFDVIIDTVNFKIRLQSRYDTPLSIVSISPVNNFTTTVTNAISPYLKPNLSCLLKVISRKGREIAKLTGDYAIIPTKTGFEGRATFDIGALFDLAPHLPDVKSLDPAIPFQNGNAFRAYNKYFLRYADKYGTTPVAESLLKTPPQYIIYGGRSVQSIHSFTPNTQGFIPCHHIGKVFATREQPTYLYFFSTKKPVNRIVVSCNLSFSDGTAITVWSGLAHNIRANRLYYYRTGFTQLSLTAITAFFNITTKIIKYDWQLIDELTREVYLTQRYHLDDTRYDSIYLAYSNGLGGIDTLHIEGGYTYKIEAERTLIRQGENLSEIGTTDATLQAVWEMQTGLLIPYVAERLSQILVGDVWLIENQQFYKLIADTKSIETKPRGTGMVSLSFTFKSAWTDRNAV